MVFNVDLGETPYRALLGVGGIGSGAFFALDGEHTLGREESRSGRFLDRRDYCKLHIIAHYVKALIGSAFAVFPIGRVGADETGSRLLKEMEAAGLDLRYAQACPGEQTLYSLCFLYPDGSGGNLTTADSACSRLEPADVARAEPEFARYAGRGIALAAPEVPLPARRALLALGTQYRFFRAASFTRAEIGPALESGMLGELDLLALNAEEAAAAAVRLLTGDSMELEGAGDGSNAFGQSDQAIVEAAVRALSAPYPTLNISITAGKEGSWSWDGSTLRHVPAFRVNFISSAGAGDAHLAGILAGLACGLPLLQAHEAGALLAGFSVTSPHTIHPGVERAALRDLAAQARPPLPAAVRKLLE